MSVDSVARAAATATSINRVTCRRRPMVQCIVIASWASFVVGVVMTTASFGPLLYPSGKPKVVIIIFQVITLPACTCDRFIY